MSEDRRPGPRPAWYLPALVLAAPIVVGAAIGIPLVLTAKNGPHQAQAGSSTTTTARAPISAPLAPTTTTTEPPPSTSTVPIPLVECTTTFGITPPPTSAALPSSETLTVPTSLVGNIALYTDSHNNMTLLGPADWSCSGSYGADGSGGVAVYPPGATAPYYRPFSPSSAEGIVGSQTSACVGCALSQACSLFPAASTAYAKEFSGVNCPAPPSGQTEDQLSSDLIAFADPPGVAGDGSPSGGPYTAKGVMTFYPTGDEGSWVATCTLPTQEKALCPASLNLFIADYGTR